jgi:hypothetical protein
MPNNQDDMKLPKTIFRPFGAPCVLKITEKKEPAMNTPTPREQELEHAVYHFSKHCDDYVSKIAELEAQNKALWELVEAFEWFLKRAKSSQKYMPTVPFDLSEGIEEAESALAAIQKVKEENTLHISNNHK